MAPVRKVVAGAAEPPSQTAIIFCQSSTQLWAVVLSDLESVQHDT